MRRLRRLFTSFRAVKVKAERLWLKLQINLLLLEIECALLENAFWRSLCLR